MFFPDVLVLGPGGMKVFLELGALLKLDSVDMLKNVHTYIGCSIGSLVALLLVSGYKPIEIINDLFGENIAEIFSFSNIELIWKNSGLLDPKTIEERINSKILEKFGKIPTLEQLYYFTGLNFISVTLNITKDQVEHLSKDTEPGLSCVKAVMMSMNVPGIFYQIVYKNCFYIDGALGNPYPIDIMDDGRNKILGISVVEKNDFSTDIHVQYIFKIIYSSMNQLKIRIKNECSPLCQHIELLSPWLDTFGVTLNKDNKIQMILIGYREAEKFIKGFHDNGTEIIRRDPRD
jgi:predicted acylesterase/phospholipase RssA